MSTVVFDPGYELAIGEEASFQFGHDDRRLEYERSVRLLVYQIPRMPSDLAQAHPPPLVHLDQLTHVASVHPLNPTWADAVLPTCPAGVPWGIVAMLLDPEPDDAIQRLYVRAETDHQASQLADRLDYWLDRLEEDHTTAAVRRHRLSSPGLWAIVMAAEGADWVILWDLDGDDVRVRYVGPASFA